MYIYIYIYIYIYVGVDLKVHAGILHHDGPSVSTCDFMNVFSPEFANIFFTGKRSREVSFSIYLQACERKHGFPKVTFTFAKNGRPQIQKFRSTPYMYSHVCLCYGMHVVCVYMP